MTPKQALIQYYHWLRRYGHNDSHSGNASVREGSTIWVTPSGACADTLRESDLVACKIGDQPPKGASLDAPLHLAVYRHNADAHALLHSHGPYTVALSLSGEDFVPVDFEGQYYFSRVPVIRIAYEDYFTKSPQRVAKILAKHPITVVCGHGVYARGTTLNLAYKWTCSLEQSAKTAFIARLAGTVE